MSVAAADGTAGKSNCSLLGPVAMFCGHPFRVGPGVLVPRPETELLARVALASLQGCANPKIIDMCCGAGNLAVTIALARGDASVVAADLTDAACAFARDNAEHLGVGDRVEVRQGDLFSALDGLDLGEGVDLIVANPPYISTGRLAGDKAYLLGQEPREAFDGGPYGVAIHQRLVREAGAFLKERGVLAFEFGIGQRAQVERLFSRAGNWTDVTFETDAAGEPRVASARVAGSGR